MDTIEVAQNTSFLDLETIISALAFIISIVALIVSYRRMKSQVAATNINLDAQHNKKTVSATKLLNGLKAIGQTTPPKSLEESFDHATYIKNIEKFMNEMDNNAEHLIEISRSEYRLYSMTKPNLDKLKEIDFSDEYIARATSLMYYDHIFQRASSIAQTVDDYVPGREICSRLNDASTKFHQLSMEERKRMWQDLGQLWEDFKKS